ncbi:hypothetical protein BC829DRAFT_264388 [Chytridium lagenaria]|nr:hypothetical protein BC829DRAFT_264388 [Chytridium lagenaria]
MRTPYLTAYKSPQKPARSLRLHFPLHSPRKHSHPQSLLLFLQSHPLHLQLFALHLQFPRHLLRLLPLFLELLLLSQEFLMTLKMNVGGVKAEGLLGGGLGRLLHLVGVSGLGRGLIGGGLGDTECRRRDQGRIYLGFEGVYEVADIAGEDAIYNSKIN